MASNNLHKPFTGRLKLNIGTVRTNGNVTDDLIVGPHPFGVLTHIRAPGLKLHISRSERYVPGKAHGHFSVLQQRQELFAFSTAEQ